MRKFNDLFKRRTPEELEAIATATHKAEIAAQVIGDRARLCLANPDFINYRKQYAESERIIIDSLLRFNAQFQKNPHADLSVFALNVSNLLTRLDTIKVLLDAVVSDAQKGTKRAV